MKFKWQNALFILAMLLVVVLLMDFSRRIDRKDRLQTQQETVESKATAVMATQVGLMTQVAYATSEAAVDEWAYVDGKWIRTGQHLVEILPEGTPPSATQTTSAPATEEIPRWRIWWELFFGEQP